MEETVAVVDAGPDGLAWVRRSLADGHAISEAVAGVDDLEAGSTFALVPPGTSPEALRYPERGGVTREAPAGLALVDLLAQLFPLTAWTLLVEDEVRRIGDPVLLEGTDILEIPPDRVAHWLELGRSAMSRVPRFLQLASTGFPTNAFVVQSNARELLAMASERPGDLPGFVAENLAAVIVAAFDAESWIIWLAQSPILPTPPTT